MGMKLVLVGIATSIGISIVGGLISGLLRVEAEAWAPRIADGLRRLALKAYRGPRRQRLDEEWSAYLNDMPGPLSKLASAFGFCGAAGRQMIAYHVYAKTRWVLGRFTVASLDLATFVTAPGRRRVLIYSKSRWVRVLGLLPISITGRIAIFSMKLTLNYFEERSDERVGYTDETAEDPEQ